MHICITTVGTFMHFEDLKTEYKTFANHIYSAHSYIEELTRETNKFLLKYSKAKNFNINFANELENNLLYFELFLQYINNLIDELEQATILKIELPKAKIENIAEYQINKECDIWVPKDFRFHITHQKNLRLLADNEDK